MSENGKKAKELIFEIFKICDTSVPGLSVMTGIPKTTLQSWKEGKGSAVAVAFLKTFKALQECRKVKGGCGPIE